MRAKLVAIVGILWVAAVGAVTLVLYANRPLGGARTHCLPQYPDCTAGQYDRQSVENWYYFEWSTWLAWVGGITLVALAAVGIIYVLTRKAD